MQIPSLTDHNLAVLWVELAALLVVARALGALARRVNQPAVTGELLAGIVLGPSVFGKVWPSGFHWFLPGNAPVQSSALLTVDQVSLVVLLVVIGAETDLRLIRQLGRAAVSVSALSLAVPFAAGLALAAFLPTALVGHRGRAPFALLMAGAVAVSSLPVIAKIVTDLRMSRRNFGQLTIAAGTANDTFGFVVVAVATALATSTGSSSVTHLAQVILTLVVLVAAVMTVGQRLVDRHLRAVRAGGPNTAGGLAAALVAAFAATALFQAVGVEGALGAFLLGVVLRRSRFQQGAAIDTLRSITTAVFAPLYFSSAGLRMDIGSLGTATIGLSFLVVLVVAAVSKFAGAYLGAALARLPGRERLALGIGLNGRGALQVIIGSAGLSTGALTGAAYSQIILMSILTSLATPPLLRAAVANWRGTSEERERLDREEELDRNVVVRGERLLIPSRGSPNSIVAAEVLHAAWPEESEATILSIGDDGVPPDVGPTAEVLHPRAVERRHVSSEDVLDEILAEAHLGYGVIGVGAAETPTPGDLLSPVIDDLLARTPLPLVIVRRAHNLSGPLPPAFSRALVPVTGSASSRAGQEVAFNISRRLGTEVVLAHVLTRPPESRGEPRTTSRQGVESAMEEGVARPPSERPRSPVGAAQGVLAEAVRLGRDMGVEARSVARHGASAGDEIVAASRELGVDLIVIGATVRRIDETPFLGHTVEHVLEHADATVVVVVLPDRTAPPAAAAEAQSAG